MEGGLKKSKWWDTLVPAIIFSLSALFQAWRWKQHGGFLRIVLIVCFVAGAIHYWNKYLRNRRTSASGGS